MVAGPLCLPGPARGGGGVAGTRSIGGRGGVCLPLPQEGAPVPWRPAKHGGSGEPGRSDPPFVSWGRKGAEVDSDRPAGWSCSRWSPPTPPPSSELPPTQVLQVLSSRLERLVTGHLARPLPGFVRRLTGLWAQSFSDRTLYTPWGSLLELF